MSGPGTRRRTLRATFWPTLVVATAILVAGSFPGTLALWTAAAPVEGGTLTAGRLDLTLDGALSGLGGTTTDAGLALSGMVPGESVTRTVTLSNAGDAPLTWVLHGSSSGALADRLEVTVWLDSSSAGNAGSAAAGDRAGGCTTGGGATQVYGWTPLPASSTSIVATPRHLAIGASRTLCVGVRLDQGAGRGVHAL